MPAMGFPDILVGVFGIPFMVVDAAPFQNLEHSLKAAELQSEPLYLDGRNQSLRDSGPFLVSLPNDGAIGRVSKIVGDKSSAVLWVWPDEGSETQSNLLRHLRGINMVEIPNVLSGFDQISVGLGRVTAHGETTSQQSQNDAKAGSSHPHELVLFRHADPNVLAMLLPLLDRGQVSRLFGRASCVVIDSPENGGLRKFVRPIDLPEMPKGWLRIRPDQYRELTNMMRHAARIRTMEFLVENGLPETDRVDWSDLYAQVRESELSGERLGLVSEASLMKWAYLNNITEGRVSRDPSIAGFFRETSLLPENRLDELMQHFENAMQQGKF